MKKHVTVIMIGLALALSVAVSASSAHLPILVFNGARLDDYITRVIANLYFGLYRQYLPSGRYWYDPHSGALGVEGTSVWVPFYPFSQLKMYLSSTGGHYPQNPTSSFFERTPGGDIGSNGECSYYFDPSTGASVMTGNCD